MLSHEIVLYYIVSIMVSNADTLMVTSPSMSKGFEVVQIEKGRTHEVRLQQIHEVIGYWSRVIIQLPTACLFN